MSTSTALDAILRGTGLPEKMWKAGVSHGAAPALPETAQRPAQQPATPATSQRIAVASIQGDVPAMPEPKPTAKTQTSQNARNAPEQRERKPATGAETLSKFLENEKPKVRLPGDNRTLSSVATDLGRYLAGVLFVHNGEVTEFRDNLLAPVAPQRFRTLIEKHVCCYRQQVPNGRVIEIDATLSESDARGILASPFFLECLRVLHHLNTVRLPVLRVDGRIELLPEGYDAETCTFTARTTTYAEDMSFESAQAELRDLFGEFQFTDGERSESVAVSALVGLFGKHLLMPGELRPAFTYLKNCEGAGATTLAATAIVTVTGELPIGSKAKDDDEMRKLLTSTIRTGQEVVFLDNMRGQLNSPSLEAFVTAPVWSDRLLGSNEITRGPNTTTVFVTSNGLSITPDWRRRSLFVELHLSEERAEDRIYKRPLSVPVLKAMRPQILAASWALIRHWDAMGRPQPTRSHSAFPAWAGTIGGIVESAGFGCPLATSNVAVVADEDGQGMRQLVAAMTPGTLYTSREIVELCRKLSIFEGLVGSNDSEMDRAQRSAFGRLLARYDDRRVNDLKFCLAGTGHGKRFHVVGPSEGRPM